MTIYNPAEVIINDTNGATFVVSPLSFSDRERFRMMLNEIYDIAKNQEDQSVAFVELYDSNMKVNTLVRMLLDLHSIDVEKISPDMLFQLLFPVDDNEMGILARVNALKPKNIDRDSKKEVKDAYHSLLAQMFELTGSIDEAVKAFTRVPAATLMSTMEALAEIKEATDPEAQKRKKQQEIMDYIKNKAQQNQPPTQ